ncbi:geranylgeranyl transferase type-2 subunit alpha 1 isoform X3 [Hevea brasiliensis]|uniref:geranylgeranyl transferase type-2 subunit alpha 1 isoform X3 n=1 Tax=Hevea brasiliensis TaxID=3981 RepID=UPI000B780CCF|nr:geranylgeranyl transferase type-2 subunit alpha 1 isoform X3 [Hevea brasiliensis]
MHGRPRKAPVPEDEAASAAKAEKLRALQSQVLSNHRHKIYTEEALELSTRLVEINPECYTAWNYRKLAFEHNLTRSDSNPNSVKSILEEELRVVEIALRQNFKSYSAWHHRKWVLSKRHSSIEKELWLLEKFQSADPRNFHAWSYRRFIAALMDRSDVDELEYTQNLIDKNISNYSAWHNRSVLLSNLMKKNVEGFTEKDEVLTKEYELVREALFTDEDDQSGWFYHLWLLDQTVKAKSPLLVSSWPAHGSDLILFQDRCLDASSSPFNIFQFDSGTFPLILYFSQAVEGVNSSTVNVEYGSNLNQGLVWKPLSTYKSRAAQAWITHKIGKLTLARLLTAYDALMSSGKLVHSQEILGLYIDLMKLDPPHYQYYKNEHSVVLLQQVMSSRESLLSRCFHYRDLTSSSRGYPMCLRLNKLSLSRIGSFAKLLWVQMLDLSHNELQSIEGLEALQLLIHLSLSENKLSSFTALEPLRQLKSLKSLDISYNEIGARSIDTTRYLCSSPLSNSIGNEWEQDRILVDGVSMTNYWEAFFVLKGLNLTQLDVVGNAIADENFTLFLVRVLPTLKWLDGVQLNLF